MNYRHAYHAGNFADLFKHAALLLLLRELTRAPEPLTVVDTHGGAGLYDLDGEMALRSGEAAAGIGRLQADASPPAALGGLRDAVARLAGGPKRYPGSPLIAAEALRRGDRLLAGELHPDDHDSLRRSLARYPHAQAVLGDGYALAREQAGAGRLLVLIDPPFERPDDYEQAAGVLRTVLARNPTATVAVWLPLKDLETFDAFLRRADTPGALVAEIRLRPLVDPMKMNGCAMVIANAPAAVEATLREAGQWIVGAAGEPGGEARLWRLTP